MTVKMKLYTVNWKEANLLMKAPYYQSDKDVWGKAMENRYVAVLKGSRDNLDETDLTPIPINKKCIHGLGLLQMVTSLYSDVALLRHTKDYCCHPNLTLTEPLSCH